MPRRQDSARHNNAGGCATRLPAILGHYKHPFFPFPVHTFEELLECDETAGDVERELLNDPSPEKRPRESEGERANDCKERAKKREPTERSRYRVSGLRNSATNQCHIPLEDAAEAEHCASFLVMS